MSSDFVALNHTLASLGPALANHLWQSTAFAAGAWLLTLALRGNQARVRHAVWLAASVKFLVPFSLLILAGNLLPHPKQPVTPAVYSAMDVVEEPFAEIALPPAAPVIHTPTMRERLEAVLPATLAAIWLVGAGVVLVVWASRWRVVLRTLREAEPAYEGRELEILRRLEGRFAEGRRARRLPLRLSAERMEPGIFGVWRPVLVWPGELSARLDDAHIEAILVHELMHVRRTDNLTAAVHMLVETMFWFHPLVWWMERRMVAEREQACDEAVVELGSDAQNFAETYAESLLKTCRFCIESPLACVAGVTGADLKRRVVGIVTGRVLVQMSWPKKLLLGSAAVCVVAAPVVLGQANAARRMADAMLKAAPAPFRAVANAMIADAKSSSIEAADASQAAAPPDTTPSADDMSLGPEFEVATIRPGNNNDGRRSFGSTVDASGKFTGSDVRLVSLVSLAYASDPSKVRVSGGPKWAEFDLFDINAKIDDAYMSGWDKLSYRERVDRMRPMMRTLLAQRFQLKLHVEMQPTPVYALVQAKGGAKMKEVPAPEAVDSGPQAAMRWMDQNPGKPRPGVIFCTAGVCTGTAVRMSEAVNQIAGSAKADRMVVDATGLKGYYDFKMTLPQPDDQDAMAEVADDLGLKFEPRTVPVKTFVIDAAEKPSLDGAEVQPANTAATPSAPAYDVVSVRQVSPETFKGLNGLRITPDGINSETQVTLPVLIRYAYGGFMKFPGDDRIVGFPDWAKTRFYSIAAKMSADQLAQFNKLSLADQQKQRELMAQSLLADRFKLKVHAESRQLPDYELVIAKGGPKLTEADPSGAPPADGFKGPDGKPVAGSFLRLTGQGKIIAQNYGMAPFVTGFLSQQIFGLGRSVVDKTGLTGKYNFTLNWTPDTGAGSASAAQSAEDQGPSVFTALQEQLGLRLQPSTGSFDILVIDHIEPPSAN